MSIQTFVFFDLETTGIPAHSAKVTEITLISVSRGDIEIADNVNLPAISKLSLLCNPKKNIQPVAAKITGLTNQFLQHQPVFKDNIKCINAFLDKPKPVCLVAHNGNRFDFKIIQAEYQAANEKLPDHLVCIDSLNVFRHILKNPKYQSYNPGTQVSTSSLDESDRAVVNEEMWQDLSMEEIAEIDELVENFSQLTPKDRKVEKKIKLQNLKEEKAPKVSFKLCNIYERLLNKKPKESHRAEVDCIMLLECVIATKHDFLMYVDSHKKILNQI